MKIKQKYIKCFSQEKSQKLNNVGYQFLYEQNGVYYHQNNENLTVKFSNTDILEDTKYSFTVNF
jgi:hypothetical protein